jgi:hypothetical protein
MDGDILIALRGAFAHGVVQSAREVVVVDDEGVAGSKDLLAHLVDARNEGILQNFEGHGVERKISGHRFTPSRE